MSEFTVIETQEQLNEIIGDRIKRAHEKAAAEAAEKYADYDEVKARNEELAKQVETLTNSATETEQKISDLEGQLAESAKYKTDLEKTRIALAAGLKVEYADRLRGDNEEEWKEDAELLAKDFKANTEVPPLGSNEPVSTNDNPAKNAWLDVSNNLREKE